MAYGLWPVRAVGAVVVRLWPGAEGAGRHGRIFIDIIRLMTIVAAVTREEEQE